MAVVHVLFVAALLPFLAAIHFTKQFGFRPNARSTDRFIYSTPATP